ncbi:MinD/ParA family protein [Cryobacterium sp. PH31-O1]|uniref:MinD/ParA family ATP-binding protein n=1 Tax=Cryobacterium sp. PH31-O1 TaxID=3046306 RepID=UPI0024B9F68C|nr:MinD/ParA family protein [Cryobacterium sp. PH31-O1]MDJ0338855.1 MinD/ParA family protein [Cryobacterium sp. PH31-O1]
MSDKRSDDQSAPARPVSAARRTRDENAGDDRRGDNGANYDGANVDGANFDGANYHSELPPHTIDNLAASLPESLSVPIELPAGPRRSVAAPGRAKAGSGAGSGAGSVFPTTRIVSTPATHTVEISTPAPARAAGASSAIESLSRTDAAASVRRDRIRSEGSTAPESAAMLTSDRLLAVNRKTRKAPQGAWPEFVYAATLHLVNLGDSAKVLAYKEMSERIRRQFEGGTRFVPILTRKGGVGKTTVTTLLGMALADARDDRIIAIDANPDRGTLSERVSKQTRSTVRDVVSKAASIGNFTDFSALVSRDETRLDILASDTDPLLSEAFDENDYNVVADLAARYYSIALTDCGTGIVHSVMRATLQRADSIVIVSGGSVDEARLASETLTWLEANGYGDLVRNAIVALNTATQGTNLVRLEEIESHFRSRVREIVRIPYDPQLAAGSVVSYKDLKSITRLAARTLAELVVEGLPADRNP